MTRHFLYKSAVMLSLGHGLGLKTNFFGLGLGLAVSDLGLGLELCGLVNNVARPPGS